MEGYQAGASIGRKTATFVVPTAAREAFNRAGINISGMVIAVYILSESCDNLRDISQVPPREIQP
jgi:hypothetical protein